MTPPGLTWRPEVGLAQGRDVAAGEGLWRGVTAAVRGSSPWKVVGHEWRIPGLLCRRPGLRPESEEERGGRRAEGRCPGDVAGCPEASGGPCPRLCLGRTDPGVEKRVVNPRGAPVVSVPARRGALAGGLGGLLSCPGTGECGVAA